MPISLDQLHSDQDLAAETADALGLKYGKLTDEELQKFGLSFERQFVLAFTEREIIDIMMRHRAEILMGAMLATEQLSKRFDGERPEAGKFGMIPIRAGVLGIGDDWNDVSNFTGGSLQNWIHSGTTLMAGTSGNPVKIGKEAVHVVVAIGDYYADSELESIQFTIDGKPKTGNVVGRAIRQSEMMIKELDLAILFKRGTTVLAKVFQKTTGTAYPYLEGASFLPENILRDYVDPASLPGTTNDVIMTT